jgi:hypothetical protein
MAGILGKTAIAVSVRRIAGSSHNRRSTSMSSSAGSTRGSLAAGIGRRRASYLVVRAVADARVEPEA